MIIKDLEEQVKSNQNFRKVLYTGDNAQVVAMSISVGDDIGQEVHPDNDQILVIIDGEADATINGETRRVEEDDLVYVPKGAEHNIVNTGDEDLKLYTIYAPPHHPDGTVHVTKKDAVAAEVEEDNGI